MRAVGLLWYFSTSTRGLFDIITGFDREVGNCTEKCNDTTAFTCRFHVGIVIKDFLIGFAQLQKNVKKDEVVY